MPASEGNVAPFQYLLGQGQRAQEVGEVVREGVKLEPHRVVPEGMAGKPRPTDGGLALLDPLLGGAAAIVELDHPPVGPGQVGDDEADPRPEFTLMPLDLGHHTTGSRPALGLVVEAGEPDDRLLRRAADRPGQQVLNPPLQHLVGRQADRVANAFGLQQLVDLGLGERRVGAEVEGDAPIAVAGDDRLQHQAPVFGAVGIAAPQQTTLQVAELVEQEERMVARAAEVAVPN